MSFEIDNTLLSPEARLEQNQVLIAHEILDREGIEKAAHYLIDNRESVAELPIENELPQNGVTGLFEKITAAGHLSHIEFPGDQEQVHLATLKRLLNAYDVERPEWDVARNFQELCEELTVYGIFKKVDSAELPEDTIVLTSSDAPDEKHVTDTEKHDNGYRMLNQKGMSRTYHFKRNEDGSWTRVLEQISRSNSNDLSTRRWFNENAAAVPIHSTGALSMQAVTTARRLPDGVLTFSKERDEVFGTDRLHGESGDEMIANGRADYSEVRTQSEQNEDMLSRFSGMLAEKDKELKILEKSGKITYQERLRLFYKEIDRKLIPRILLNSPQFARDTYGVIAAEKVYVASMHFQQGNFGQAEVVLAKAFQTRDKSASTGCGGAGADKDGEPNPDDIEGMVKEAVEGAKEDKDTWTWTDGVCRVESCKAKTKVGPCSICKKCQKVFDSGGNPTEKSANNEQTKGLADIIASMIVKNEVEKAKNEQFAVAA